MKIASQIFFSKCVFIICVAAYIEECELQEEIKNQIAKLLLENVHCQQSTDRPWMASMTIHYEELFLDLEIKIKNFTEKDRYPQTVKKEERNKNVQETKALIIATSDNEPPFVKINGSSYKGVVFNLMDHVATTFNLTYTVLPPVKTSGAIVDGHWNGLIGMIEREEADIALASLTVTNNRSQVVDFSTPYFYQSLVILMHKPEIGESLLRLLTLFNPDVWLLYLTSILAAVFMIWVLQKFTVVPGDHGVETLTKSAWYVYSNHVNQVFDRKVIAWSGRIFEVVWRFASFVVITIYTGGFVADLTTNRLRMPVTNLNELITATENGQYHLCIEDHSAFSSVVFANYESTYAKLKTILQDNPSYLATMEECRNRVIANKNVVLIIEETAATELQKQFCNDNKNLIILDHKFFPVYFSIAFRKNFLLTQQISNEITKTIESGLMEVWYRKESSDRPFCEIFQPNELFDTSSEPLKITQVGGAFILLACGCVIGLGFLISETKCFKHMFSVSKLISWK